MFRRVIYILIIFFPILEAEAINLSKVNFSYLYDGSFNIKHQIILKNDTFFLQLEFDEKPNTLNFLYQKKYSDNDHVKVDHTVIDYDAKEAKYLIRSKFKNQSQFSLLVLEIKQAKKSYYFDIQINQGMILGHLDFSLIHSQDSTVFLKNYITRTKNLTTIASNDSMACYVYQPNFAPALPPMVTGIPPGNKSLQLDSIYYYNRTLRIDSINKLFFVQKDSSTNIGRGFITVSDYFPKFRLPQELIQPLVYISTKSEYQEIITTENKKKAFDNFWVRTLKNKDRAKSALKKFYSNVTKANGLFTNYKEGWKTDPGLIYVVFGNPMEVVRNQNEEKWSYVRFGEKITFNFEKIPNLFVRTHLRLQRNNSYSKIWFRAVSSWRKGNL